MINPKDYLNRGIDYARETGTEAAGLGKATARSSKKAAKSFLTSDGYKTLSSKIDDLNFGIGGFGLIAETAGTIWGTNYRLKQGEALLPSLGKELVENTVYGVAPQLMIGMIGKAAVQAYPAIKDAASQKEYYSKNMNYLGGNYLDAQSNYASRARALEQIKRSRSTIASSVGGEAKRYHF